MSTVISSLPSSLVSVPTTKCHRVEADVLAAGIAMRGADDAAPESVSAATERLRLQIRALGPHFRAALIRGERGARKEEVARSLHFASPVAKGPFVVCDSGLMETLIRSNGTAPAESEDRAACRQLARTATGGTIFFPELGLFSLTAQKELLHFMECLKGEQGSRVRVIASVSGDVQALVAGGMLLPELRESIGVVELSVAPLRERLADFAAVAIRILGQIAKQTGAEPTGISESALRELQRRGWPGNERELESALRMARLTSGGAVIEERHLPPPAEQAETAVETAPAPRTSSMRLQDVMDAHLLDVLRRCDGNKLKAAEVLGISRSTLYRMLDAVAAATN